jgi:hypothetical protein
MSYGFEKKVRALERKHRKEELEYLRKWVLHLYSGLNEELADRLKQFFPKEIEKMTKKELMSVGGLIERTLDNEPLLLKAVEASFENIEVDGR